MRKSLAALFVVGSASPAFAAKGPFFSLTNTDLIVATAFLVFIGVLFYFKVPTMIGKMLDQRAEGIQSEIDEARALREEAQTILASYERKQNEVQEQADRIVATAREEAQAAAQQARVDLEKSIARRMSAAEEQIESAQEAAVREVRDQAVAIAISAAHEVLAKQMTADKRKAMIDASIDDVAAKLH